MLCGVPCGWRHRFRGRLWPSRSRRMAKQPDHLSAPPAALLGLDPRDGFEKLLQSHADGNPSEGNVRSEIVAGVVLLAGVSSAPCGQGIAFVEPVLEELVDVRARVKLQGDRAEEFQLPGIEDHIGRRAAAFQNEHILAGIPGQGYQIDGRLHGALSEIRVTAGSARRTRR